jgi:hypothetical protein
MVAASPSYPAGLEAAGELGSLAKCAPESTQGARHGSWERSAPSQSTPAGSTPHSRTASESQRLPTDPISMNCLQSLLSPRKRSGGSGGVAVNLTGFRTRVLTFLGVRTLLTSRKQQQIPALVIEVRRECTSRRAIPPWLRIAVNFVRRPHHD